MEKLFKIEDDCIIDTRSGEVIDKPDVSSIGQDGNAFSIMSKCSKALKSTGHKELVDQYIEESKSGDYNNLLRTAMKYCNIM